MEEKENVFMPQVELDWLNANRAQAEYIDEIFMSDFCDLLEKHAVIFYLLGKIED